MKACFLVLFLGLFCSLSAQDITRKWDIRLSAAGGTRPYLQTGEKFLSFHLFRPEFEETAYNIDVLYRTPWKGIKLGVLSGFTTVKQFHLAEWSFTGSSDETYLLAKKKYISVIPAVSYTFLLRPNSQLYSQAGFGIAFLTEKSRDGKTAANSVRSAYQFTALGYRLGQRLAFFGELGYGYQGIIKIGLCGSF